MPSLIKVADRLPQHRRPPELYGWKLSAGATVPLIAVAIVLATAVNSSSESGADIYLAKAARTLGFNLRGALFAHLQRLPLAFHLERGTGDVLTRLTGDVKAMEDFVEDSVSDLLGSVLILVATLSYLFWKSWQIALLAVATVPLLSVVSTRVRAAAQVRLQAAPGQ